MTRMADPRTAYHTIPPLDDRLYCSGIHEPRVLLEDRIPTSKRRAEINAEARARWTFFLLGCTILLPWNALMNGMPFFLYRLVNSPFYATLGSDLSGVYMTTKLICQFYCTFTSKQSSPMRRIFVSITGAMLLLARIWISTLVRNDTSSSFFVDALFSTASLAIASGYMGTAVYAVASRFGAPFLQSVISGQAAVAVVASALQVVSSVTLLWESKKSVSVGATTGDVHAEESAAQIFFGVSIIFLGVTLYAFRWLMNQPFYQSAPGAPEQYSEARNIDELTRLVVDVPKDHPSGTSSSIYHVFKQNWGLMFSIAYVFAVTLAVFPAITIRVRSANPDFHPMIFIAVHFLVANTGDFVGRYTCSFPSLIIWSTNKILAMSLLRTLFIPLVLLCNIYRPEITPSVSPIINSDFFYMVILFAMGYTNGYVATAGLLSVSSLEYNPRLEGCREDVDTAATLGGSIMIAGLTVGALCSFGVQAMV